MRLTLENGQFKVGIVDAQGQVQKLGVIGSKAGDEMGAGFTRARQGVASISGQLAAARTQLIAFFGVRELARFSTDLVRLSDQYQTGAARLKLFTRSQEELTTAQRETFEIAQRTRTGLQDTIGLYSKLADAVRSLGGNQAQTLAITETVNQALQVSGASGAAASSAIMQFGQALSGGVLRAEEFNSVIEAAPRLAQALADGLNVPRGALRALVNEGKVTADQIVKALLSQRAVLEREFASLPLTVAGALTQVRNAFEQLVGQNLGGATGQLAQVISLAATNLAALVEAVLRVGQVVVAVFIGKAVAAVAAYLTEQRKLIAQSALAGAAALQEARAEAVNTAAKVENTRATLLAVQAARADAVAALASADAKLVQARAAVAASSHQVAANHFLVLAERELTAATLARQAAVNGLGVLGRQQANLQRDLALQTMNAASASRGAATATTAASVGARLAATGLGLFRGALGLLGGPVGAAITGLSLLALWFTRTKDAASDAAVATRRSVDQILADAKKIGSAPGLSDTQQSDLSALQSEALRIAQAIAITDQVRSQAAARGDAAAVRQVELSIESLKARLSELTAAARSISTANDPLQQPLLATTTADADDAKKAAEAAKKLRNEEFEHFQQMLRDEIDALEEQADLKRDLNTALLEAEGKDYEASLEKLKEQYQGWLATLGRSAEGAQLAEKVFNAAKARLLADALKRQAQDLLSGLERRSQSRARTVQNGSSTQAAAAQQDDTADYARSVAAFEKIADTAKQIGGPVGDDLRSTLAGVAEDLLALQPPTNQWRDTLMEIGNLVTGELLSGFEAAFKGLQDGTRSVGDAFKDLAGSVVESIQRMIAKTLAFYAVQKLVGLVSGGTLDLSSAGVIVKKAGGGMVRGPGTSTSDSIPARLSDGEYVVRASSVSKFGRGFFDALNAGFAPTFATRGYAAGGYVGGGGSSSGGPVIQIINAGEPMKASKTERGSGSDGSDLYKIFVEPAIARDIARNGPITQQLSSALGLQRTTAVR